MDERLHELARAVEADPGDAGAARRYERALVRAGQRGSALARYRRKFLCGVTADELHSTADPWTLRCARCARPVYLATAPADVAARLAAGDCAAVDARGLEAAVGVLLDDPALHSADEPGRPCLVGWSGRPARRITGPPAT